MSLSSSLFLVHIFCCWFMTGVIWIVQVLVYPNFVQVGEKEFRQFHLFHLNRITWVVAPIMGLELVSAVGLVVTSFNFYFILNLITVLIIWILTAFINVPSHDRLSHNKEIESKLKLVKFNWPRTVLWSLRSISLAAMVISIKLIGE